MDVNNQTGRICSLANKTTRIVWEKMDRIKNEGIDRRVQRTRQLLNEALMSLIVEKDYDSITVQDIIDRANLGRSTFYAHYQDKDDLLLSGMEEVVHRLISHVENSTTAAKGSGDASRILYAFPMFQHAQEQYPLHKAIIGGQGIDVIVQSIQDHLSSHIQEHIEQVLPDGQLAPVPPPVMANYLAGALLNLLTWWIDHDMPYPPERMDEIFQALVMPGVRAVLGSAQ